MSVIVKSMEMPKNCSDCPLNYDQMSCIVTGTRWWSDTMVLMGFDSDKERLHDCPLIELPPHSRLIDATFEENHYASMLLNPTPDVTEQDKHKARIIIEALRMAQTVIEAEGETDGR